MLLGAIGAAVIPTGVAVKLAIMLCMMIVTEIFFWSGSRRTARDWKYAFFAIFSMAKDGIFLGIAVILVGKCLPFI